MKRFGKSIQEENENQEDSIFQVKESKGLMEIMIRGEKRSLCRMLACALEHSNGAQEILNKAMALFALRKRMQGKGPKAGNRNKLT